MLAKGAELLSSFWGFSYFFRFFSKFFSVFFFFISLGNQRGQVNKNPIYTNPKREGEGEFFFIPYRKKELFFWKGKKNCIFSQKQGGQTSFFLSKTMFCQVLVWDSRIRFLSCWEFTKGFSFGFGLGFCHGLKIFLSQ